MTNDGAPDLAGLCADLADELTDELDEVSSSADGDVVSYARGGAVFVRVSGSSLEVRLPADIAEAALRTPDTALDPDDRGWLRFTPKDDERHAVDRAAAWFQTAWRHAADN
jgi:hypothetical protein